MHLETITDMYLPCYLNQYQYNSYTVTRHFENPWKKMEYDTMLSKIDKKLHVENWSIKFQSTMKDQSVNCGWQYAPGGYTQRSTDPIKAF